MTEKTVPTLPENLITLKEVYERLIALEAKFDLAVQTDNKTVGSFRTFVLILVSIGVANIVISLINFLQLQP